MNKKAVFLINIIMLLGLVVIPTGPVASFDDHAERSVANPAATSSTGTMKILVSEDVGVANGTYADGNFGDEGILFVGVATEETYWVTGRSYFKFNFTHLPSEVAVKKATMNIYCADEWLLAGGNDEPVGVYHCDNDSWDDMTLTWNTQPSFSSTPTDVIDSPASPDMFEEYNWYSWDVTSDVRTTLADDKILTEVLKQVSELGTQDAFWYPFDSSVNQFYATYIEIEYTAPTTSSLSVDGITSGPLLDYIHSESPELGWSFSDSDPNDFQRDYDVEVWNNQYYNHSLLWKNTRESVYTIRNSFGDAPPGNAHPFYNREEFRLQMKFPSVILPYDGIVDKLYFTSSVDSGILESENLEISMVMVENSAYLTADLQANLDGRTPTVVLSRDLYQVEVVNGVVAIDVENTFLINKNLNLIIEIRLTNNTADGIYLNRTTSGGPGSVAAAREAGAYTATTADYTAARTYDLKIGYLTKQVFSGQPLSDNGFPFDTTPGYGGRFQIKYNQSYIDRAGYIDRAFMRVDLTDGNVVFENFSVTLVESPVLGPIENGTWTENYGGAVPKVVINEDMYTVRNLGGCIILDFVNTFYYSNTHDLLIDIQWDSLVSGGLRVLYDDPTTSSYRAWDLHYMGVFQEGSGSAGYDLMLDFIDGKDLIHIDNSIITLVNATRYYWRTRTCDSVGMWSNWATSTFKYEVRHQGPAYSEPVIVPSDIRIGSNVTVSLNVTHEVGIYQVKINFNGTDYIMINDGDSYSFNWSPTTTGTVDFTISMQSNADTWSYVSGSFNVIADAEGIDPTTLIIIGGVVAVVVVIALVVLIKRKPAK